MTRDKLIYNTRSDCPTAKFDFLYEALDQINDEDDGLYLSDFTQTLSIAT
jgi:hypothetical protein